MLRILVLTLLFSVAVKAEESLQFKVITRTYHQVPVAIAYEPGLAIHEQIAKNGKTSGSLVQGTVKEEVEDIVSIGLSKISKAIKDVRSGICSTLVNGTVKIWLSATKKGSILVAESSVAGGIEVQINCIKGE